MAIAVQPQKYSKDKKVDIYYYDNKTKKHLCTQRLLWCYIRDLSVGEKSNYMDSDMLNVAVLLYINYNKTLLDLKWKYGEKHERKLYAKINDRVYWIAAKPDEYEHNKSDLKMVAQEGYDDLPFDSEEWAKQ